MIFGAHKLVHSEPFLDYLIPIRILTLAVSARQRRAQKFLYRCTSTYTRLNYCRGIFFKSLSYLYEVVRTIFSADFWTVAIFDRNFAKIVAPRHLATNVRTV